jgi:hypothetical protein
MRVPVKPAGIGRVSLAPLVLGTLGAAAAAIPCVREMSMVRDTVEGTAPEAEMISLSTAIVAACVLFAALRAQTRSGGACAIILGGVGAGLVNSGIALFLVTLAKDGSVQPLLIPMGMLFGCFYGGPLGLAYGLALAVIVVPALGAKVEPSFDAFDRVLLWSGLWALAVGGVCVAVDGGARPLDWVVAAAGASAVVCAAVRLVVRRAWLARVRAGKVDGWRVEPRGHVEDVGLSPFVRARSWDAVLVRDEVPASVPYRDPPLRRAVALVP